MIDPRLLEEIAEASQESLFSSLTARRNEMSQEQKKDAKSQVQAFMIQFMDLQLGLTGAIRLIASEVNSLPEKYQLEVLHRLRAAFAEMKTTVTYFRSAFAF